MVLAFIQQLQDKWRLLMLIGKNLHNRLLSEDLLFQIEPLPDNLQASLFYIIHDTMNLTKGRHAQEFFDA